MGTNTTPLQSDFSVSDDALWRAAIDKQTDYYLPRFAKYERGERCFPSWHWPAFFGLGWWALYRKAWGCAVLFFALPVLLVAPILFATRLVASEDPDARRTAYWASALACSVIAAMLANRLYYRRVRALVTAARAAHSDEAARLAHVRAKAGTFGAAGVVGFGIGFSVAAIALFLLAVTAPSMYFFNRGLTYQERGDDQGAIREYDQAVRTDPDNPVIFMNRGNAYRDKGDYEHAFRDYDQALRLKPRPNEALVLINRGVAYSRAGDNDRAIQSYNEAIRLDSAMPLAFSNRGYAHALKAEYVLAIEDLDRALRLDPNLVHAIVNRGLTNYFRGQFAAAAEDFARAQQLVPESPHRALLVYLARTRAAQNPVDQGVARGDLAQAGARFDLTKWPGQVFSLYLGTIDEQAALAASADPRYPREVQCQAYFFVGQYLVLSNRKEEAATIMQAVPATGVTDSVYCVAARAELKRLAQ